MCKVGLHSEHTQTACGRKHEYVSKISASLHSSNPHLSRSIRAFDWLLLVVSAEGLCKGERVLLRDLRAEALIDRDGVEHNCSAGLRRGPIRRYSCQGV